MKLFENEVPIGEHEIAVIDYANNDIKTAYEEGQRPFTYLYTYDGYLDACEYCRIILEMSDEEINSLSREQKTESATDEDSGNPYAYLDRLYDEDPSIDHYTVMVEKETENISKEFDEIVKAYTFAKKFVDNCSYLEIYQTRVNGTITSVNSWTPQFGWFHKLQESAIKTEADDPNVYYFDGEENIPFDVVNVVINDGVTEIKSHAFAWCQQLKSVAIPYSVKRIESKAFICCTSLESITIPDSVEEVANDAFEGCVHLKNIDIPANAQYTEDDLLSMAGTSEEVTESVAENGEANEFGGYDIGENQSDDSTYEYYNFYYEGKKFALTKCLDGYKASDCVGKIYVKPIHPYDEAERPWAVSSDGGYHWRIMCNKKMIDGINTDDLQHVLRVVKLYDDDIDPIRAID